MSDELEIIQGPIVPQWGGSIIYSVTLGNGYVITNPNGFGGEGLRPSGEPTSVPKPLTSPQQASAPMVRGASFS